MKAIEFKPKIVVKLEVKESEGLETLKKLAEKGLKVNMKTNKIFTQLNEITNNSSSGIEYVVPPELFRGDFYINVAEFGGGQNNSGTATIVCGVKGTPLRPYYVPNNPIRCGWHAFYSVPQRVITVTGYRRNDRVTIREFWIVREAQKAFLKSRIIWEGENLPERFKHFSAAVEAARIKADCFHCRCVHYAAQ